ncbi:MAG: hypothetical protein J6R83_04195, partial [Clostridia bacterium]|nr:hypothetical protein [Clostridia bacterium]
MTDALEKFAERDEATIYEVKSAEDMLTYSTKTELRSISKYFMRKASQFVSDIENQVFSEYFIKTYGDDAENQKTRYKQLLNGFISKFGDRNVVITRSPARINIMGRHIDHRGGSINVMTTDKDVVFVSAMRDDDQVNIANIDAKFPDKSFSISECLGDVKYDKWLDYLADPKTVEQLENNKGCWSNYIKSAVLRAQFDSEIALCGMDVFAGGTIPVAAGLSSSSSLVVATMEAVVALNCLNITNNKFISLCGEGEWFVGSRGGSGDHAAMKCGSVDKIVHLKFKPFEVGESAKFSDEYSIVVANSMIQAKKSEGSKHKYNAKVASYEFAFMLIKRLFPDYNFVEFRDLAKVRPFSKIYEIIKEIPETVTKAGILAILPEYKDTIKKILSTHTSPDFYDLRGVAIYGVSECARSETCIDLLNQGRYEELGQLMKISHDGDRVGANRITDEMLDEWAKNNVDIAMQSGVYDCSTEQIDYLCDLLNSTDGVLGSEIVGAGLGGCVIALVKKSLAN